MHARRSYSHACTTAKHTGSPCIVKRYDLQVPETALYTTLILYSMIVSAPTVTAVLRHKDGSVSVDVPLPETQWLDKLRLGSAVDHKYQSG